MKKFIPAVLLFLSFLSTVSFGAGEYYMYLEGEKVGKILGESVRVAYADAMVVTKIDNTIIAGRNPETGLPTGKRQHMPIHITKEIDKSTPLLMEALRIGDILNGEIKCVKTDTNGVEYVYLTIKLVDAEITSISQDLDAGHDLESISFAYRALEQEIIKGKTFVEIDWQTMPTSPVRISDLNYDGIVDLLDLSTMAKEWLGN